MSVSWYNKNQNPTEKGIQQNHMRDLTDQIEIKWVLNLVIFDLEIEKPIWKAWLSSPILNGLCDISVRLWWKTINIVLDLYIYEKKFCL